MVQVQLMSILISKRFLLYRTETMKRCFMRYYITLYIKKIQLILFIYRTVIN